MGQGKVGEEKLREMVPAIVVEFIKKNLMCCKWLSVVGFQLSVKDFRFCNHLPKLGASYKVVNCYMNPRNSHCEAN